MAEYDYDLITLGAGSGGVRASRLAAQTGAKVAVVEVSRVGGTCVLRGCVPKKLLVIGAHYAEDFADAQGYGWDMGEARFDWPTLIHHKNQELDRLNGIYVRLLRDAGVELIEGRGILADPHTIEVDGKRLTARLILVATGGWPSLPQVPGIEHAITSNEALDLERQPKRLVIVGGGYIAVEFAGIFNALGSKVTQIVRGDTVLRGFDQDIRTTLGAEMTKKGVDLRAQSVVRSIEPYEGGFSVRLEGIETVEADCVFYATGRAPNSKGLGLEEAGITLDSKGAVMVDEYSRTAVPHIYAVGDVTNRMNLTPVATAEARCFVETAFGNNPLAMDYDNIPSAVFSMPPCASAGLTEGQARQRWPSGVDIFVTSFKPMRHTLSGRDERTMMKLVVRRYDQRVVGCHMVGPDSPEIMQGLAIALKCGATKGQFDATVGIHPTAAEEFVTMREPLRERRQEE